MNRLLLSLTFTRVNIKKLCLLKREKKNRLDYSITVEDIISQWDVVHKNTIERSSKRKIQSSCRLQRCWTQAWRMISKRSRRQIDPDQNLRSVMIRKRVKQPFQWWTIRVRIQIHLSLPWVVWANRCWTILSGRSSTLVLTWILLIHKSKSLIIQAKEASQLAQKTLVWTTQLWWVTSQQRIKQ